MSTPSVTILKNLVLNWKSNQMEEETIATFYRHYDGYPSCHAIDIASSLVVASRTKPEHIDFSGASVERDILNNRNWCLFAVYNMQDVWSFPLISCFPACWYASLLYL